MLYDNSLRQHWVAAGYRSDMGSAAIGLPPSAQWIRLYHLLAPEHALSNVERSRLKVSRFRDLNDPFELMGLNFRYGQVRKLVREFKDAADTDTGLLCFSEDWTSPVMWSHYAARHKGVALGFDVLRQRVEKVEYEPKRLLPDLGESDEPFGLTEEIKSRLQRTKCHEWQYEQEWRMFVRLDDAQKEGELHFYPLAEQARLAEVILGPNCELQLQEVRSRVQRVHPHAHTFCARLATQHFKVVPKESTLD